LPRREALRDFLTGEHRQPHAGRSRNAGRMPRLTPDLALGLTLGSETSEAGAAHGLQSKRARLNCRQHSSRVQRLVAFSQPSRTPSLSLSTAGHPVAGTVRTNSRMRGHRRGNQCGRDHTIAARQSRARQSRADLSGYQSTGPHRAM
jgi:hypothetical protein